MTTVDVERQDLLIGGRWVPSERGGTYDKANP
jgi:hypothetical protein